MSNTIDAGLFVGLFALVVCLFVALLLAVKALCYQASVSWYAGKYRATVEYMRKHKFREEVST